MFSSIKRQANFKVVITELYPQNPWELVAYPFGFAEHTCATTAVEYEYFGWNCLWTRDFSVRSKKKQQ